MSTHDPTRHTCRSRHGAHPALGDPIMSLALTCDDPTRLVAVSGEVDMSNAHLLTELVQFVCRPPLPVVTVDLSAVTFFSAHGVSALLESQHIAAGAGAAFLLREPAPCVSYLLSVTGALASFRLSGGTAQDAPSRSGGSS